MTYLLFGLLDAFERGFIGVILILDTLIYGLISSAFRIFMAIAGARLLSSDAYTAIANKIYLIIGVLMLFVLSYGILKAIVNPDEGAKQMGPGLLKKIAIAVIGLAITPALFNLMYQAQGLILEHDVLAKLFFRSENTEKLNVNGSVETDDGNKINYSGDVNPDDYVKNIGGAVTATTIWQAFFYPSEDSGLDATEIIADPGDYLAGAVGNGVGCAVSTAGLLITAYTGWTGWGAVIGLLTAGAGAIFCTNAVADATAYDQASKITTDKISLADAYVLTSSSSGTGNFGIYTVFLDNYLEEGEISYLFGISTLCGAFVLYAFATFSIDMGVRAAKLAYFQVIAPIPLVMQILPGKDGKFKEYTKMVINTFMEVFIRISVVYIVVYIICHLQDLFSSVDALWGNTDLSTGELMFALAFLIIGLILFCKEAPGFLGKALGVDTGGMKLGLGWKDTREKLGKGGVFNAAGVGYGAVTSGVRNFRNGIDNKKGFLGTLGSTIAGVGSGAARAAKSQMFGFDKHPSMSWKNAKDAGEKAAQAATDKRDSRDEREALLEQARRELHLADSELNAARASGNQARITKAQRRVEEARKRFNDATALGSALSEAGRRIDSWSIGSVSLAKEEADIKFSNALKKLRDEAREEAYKKDLRTQGYKKKLEELQSREISEYNEGWDEESYNQAIRDRIATELTALTGAQSSKVAAEAARNAARTALNNARATGNAAAIAAAQADLTAREADLTTATADLATAQATFDTARTSAISELSVIAKKKQSDLDEERFKLQREVKITKDLMEASADEWVSTQIGDKGSDVSRIYQEFLNNNQEYIQNNGSRVVFTNKNGVSMNVTQMIEDFTADGQTVMDVTVQGQQSVANKRFVFDPKNGGPKVTYTRNSNGRYDASDGSATDISLEDLFAGMTEKLKKAGNSAEFKADTASTSSSGKGKTAAEGIPVSDSYRDKVRRKRQADEAKSGKK